MASTDRENVQMAGLGRKGRPDRPEALLISVPSRRAAITGFGPDTSSVNQQGTEEQCPGSEAADTNSGRKKNDAVISIPAARAETQELPYSVSLSVPASPSGLHHAHLGVSKPPETKVDIHYPSELHQARYYSQPTLRSRGGEVPMMRSNSTRDRRFDHFKTFSGRLERHLSNFRGLPAEIEPVEDDQVPTAARYFAALEGPELETLRATEVPALPNDEPWPFLLRFPISAFGMCLGVSSQAMLWKTLESEPSTAFLGVSPAVNHVLWWISVALTGLVSATYLLKVVLYFEAVRREFYHPVRGNFFFAPWIACLFLAKGVPRPVAGIHHAVWYLLMAPILCLDLKIYGQWMSSGARRLSRVANPSNHLAVVGNFVGALLGARMGLREAPVFFFAVGLAHYAVLFVTLYQRLPTNAQLPKELHPVFFLFVAAPSVASMAWARISGRFNGGAKLSYFISLFLYSSLAVRVNFFRGFRFSLAWWAYTFPMTSAALATTLYATEVNNALMRALAVGLSGVSSVTVTSVLLTTVYHAFVRRDLFPNDVSIAVTKRSPAAKFSKFKELAFSISKQGDSAATSSGDAPPVTYDLAGR